MDISIATLGSHSALDVSLGAKKQGFKTVVVVEKGREKTYDSYYKTRGDIGCIDETIEVQYFADILSPRVQEKLRGLHAVFVPNRSFEAYLNFNYEAIESLFSIPIFGNKFLLKIEERGTKPNQYDLLSEADIRIPKQFANPKTIDRLVLVKALEKERAFERAFFLVSNYKEYKATALKLLKAGMITEYGLKKAVIEEFVLGAQVNFNFFYSVIHQRLELLGTDTRRQTNLDGLLRLPSMFQSTALEKVRLSYEEAGHIAVTVLESLLEKAFILGEAFVKASQKLYPPGIIGPFALQTLVVAGPPKKDIIVIDVSPRMPGSPGIVATPYSSYLFRRPVSVGERVAMEIMDAIKNNQLKKIIT